MFQVEEYRATYKARRDASIIEYTNKAWPRYVTRAEEIIAFLMVSDKSVADADKSELIEIRRRITHHLRRLAVARLYVSGLAIMCLMLFFLAIESGSIVWALLNAALVYINHWDYNRIIAMRRRMIDLCSRIDALLGSFVQR